MVFRPGDILRDNRIPRNPDSLPIGPGDPGWVERQNYFNYGSPQNPGGYDLGWTQPEQPAWGERWEGELLGDGRHGPEDLARVGRGDAEVGRDIDQYVKNNPATGWDSLTQMQKMQVGAGVGGGIGKMIASLFHKRPDKMLEAYQHLKKAYANLDDPEILKQVWEAPIIQQIARFSPELVRGIQEDMSQYEIPETDAGVRAKQMEGLARIEDRAVRGDPLTQRIQTQEAANAMARSFGGAGQTAASLAARRGMPGGGISGRDMAQGGAGMASRMGTSAVLAGRKDMATAEARSLAGATGIRQQDDRMKERAAMIRNTFRNAMANRRLAAAQSNQLVRQNASNMNQALGQQLHQTNVTARDRRQIENQRQKNTWERERYGMDRQRLDDDAYFRMAIAREQDQATRDRNQGISDLGEGIGSIAGGGLGLM